MTKFMLGGVVLLFCYLHLKKLLLFIRFKREKRSGKFMGDFYQYKLKSLIKIWPSDKPKLNNHYKFTPIENLIGQTFFFIGVLVLIGLT